MAEFNVCFFYYSICLKKLLFVGEPSELQYKDKKKDNEQK